MLKNINDILSVIALALIVIICIKYFFGAFFSFDASKVNTIDKSRSILLKDYLNNSDE